MAVLIEAISVVIRVDALLSKFSGGWDAFKSRVPNQTLCADNELARVGFMSPEDSKSFVQILEQSGLIYLEDGQAIDLVVVDKLRGLASPCSWAEFGHVNFDNDPKKRVAACRLAGSINTQLVTPPNWRFDNSLSHSYGFAPSEHADRSLTFLRHESGLDVYLNSVTGEEVYIGRTSEGAT